MHINTTAKPLVKRNSAAPLGPAKSAGALVSQDNDTFTRSSRTDEGFVSAGLSVVAGAAALYGASTGNAPLVAGATLVTAATSGMAAMRVQDTGVVDTAAVVAFSGVGLAGIAAGISLFGPEVVTSKPPTGPLPTFLRKLGIRHL